jgi:NAD(P)-dependent dehydrogenase (short-subunit alcohol dehydrogenase family)
MVMLITGASTGIGAATARQAVAVRLALDRFGSLDVVFANAGFGATRGFLE